MSRKILNFYDWCVLNNRQELLEQWDWDKNFISPTDVRFRSTKAFYFKCPDNKHDSEEIVIGNLVRTKHPREKCSKCCSIAQFLLDMYGENGIDKYWDYNLNNKNPWEINAKSHTEIYIKCQNTDYHGSYPVEAKHFTLDNVRCSYCFHRKVHPKDSFAQYGINKFGTDFLEKYWDFDKNIKNPWEISPKTKQSKIYIKCQYDINHGSFLVDTHNFFNEEYACPECVASKNQRILQILNGLEGGSLEYSDVKSELGSFEDLCGKQFGRLTVLSLDYQKLKNDILSGRRLRYYWICQCECGGNESIKSIEGCHLKSGKTISCGCWRVERSTGENAWNWNGGVNSENHKARHTLDGKQWRKNVLERDDFTCQCCGSKEHLHVHHIYNFSDNFNVRYDVDNGVVLCDKCHDMKIKGSFHHMYGTKNNTSDQLREYILNKSNIDIYITHPNIKQIILHDTMIIGGD